jgi:V8-like Glu-specific endopeptidase
MSEKQRRPAVHKRVFVGDRSHPERFQTLVERKPHRGTGILPEDLLTLRRSQSTFVVGGENQRPKVVVERVKSYFDSEMDGWRIDVTLDEKQLNAGNPGIRIRREEGEVYRQGINNKIGHAGHRPEWMDATYIPKLQLSPHRHARMRRFSGRTVQPMWEFFPDAWHLFRDSSYPWGCIGIISNSDGYTGTGVLVGPNIVATAGHMVPEDNGHAWMKFVPADYVGMGSLYGQNVYSYATDAQGYLHGSVSGYDWAILKLERPLGSMVGYMGYNSYSDDWEGQNYWTVVGYPGGGGPFWQGGVIINDDDEDSNDGQELESANANTLGGSSGGPIFAWWGGDPRIIGVVSGEETEHVGFVTHPDNVFAAGPGLHNLIAWGRSNWA